MALAICLTATSAAFAQGRALTQWQWMAHGDEIEQLPANDPDVAVRFTCTVDHAEMRWPSIIGTPSATIAVSDGDVLSFEVRVDADSDMPNADVPVKWQCPNMGLQINFRPLIDRFAQSKGEWMKVAVPLAAIDALRLSFYVAEKDYDDGAQVTVSVRNIVLHRGSREPAVVDVPQLTSLHQSYPAIRAFDFGKADTAVRSGFDQVTPRTAYDEQTGYGWQTGGAMTAASYDTGMYSTNTDYWGSRNIPPKVYTNELSQDFVQGTDPATFRMDLPNGEYRMYFLMGWAYMGGSQINDPPVHWTNLSVNGEPREQIKLDRASYFAHQVIDVTVTDGVLDVGFSTQDFAWLINAIVVYPRDCEQAIEPYLDEVNLEIDYLPKPLRDNWQEVPNLVVNPEPTPSPADRDRGFVLFVRNILQEVYPTSRPAANEIGRDMRTFTPPGEAVAATFGMYPLRDLRDIRIEAGTLRSADGHTLSADCIEINRVRCILSKVGDFNPGQTGHSRLIPEILAPGRPFDVAAKEATRLWLTITVPQDAAPGDYRGVVTVAVGDDRVGEVALHVKVLPFELQADEQMVYTFMWGPPYGKLHHYRKSAFYDQLETFLTQQTVAELQSMKAHGFNTIFLTGCLPYSVENDALEIDFSIIEKIAALSRDAGFDRPMILNFDGRGIAKGVTGKMYPKGPTSDIIMPERFYELYADLLVQVEQKREAMGWPEFIYLLEDEPNSGHYQRFCDRIYSQLRRRLPDIKLVMTGREDTQRVLTEHLYGRIYPAYSEWTMFDERTTAQECAEAGDVFWAYPNIVTCGSGTQPALSRYLYGTWGWKVGISGFMPFGFNDKLGNPFNHFDSFYRGAGVLYPGWDDYPVETTQYEGMREGIVDRKYFHTLQQLIDQARQHADERIVSEARRIAEELAAIRDAIPYQATFLQRYCFASVWQYPDTENVTWVNEAMEDYRWWMACQIIRLSRLVAGKDVAADDAGSREASFTARVVERDGADATQPDLSVVATYAGDPPTIDGRLDEPAWETAGVIDGFMKLGAVNRRLAEPATRVRVLCDGEYLYLSAECDEPDAAVLQKVSTETHDGDRVWADECIEIFLDPTRQAATFYQVIINSDGIVLDAIYLNGEKMDKSWDSHVRAACRKLEDRWVLEAAIPIDRFGSDSDVWGFNIGRERHTDVTDLSSWTSSWAPPSDYGQIVLARSDVYIKRFDPPESLFGANEVEIVVANMSGESYDAGAQLLVTAGDGSNHQHAAFEVAPGGEKTVAIPYNIDRAGPAELTVTLPSDDGVARSKNVCRVNVPQPIAVTMPSYVVRGVTQDVKLRLNLSPSQLEALQLHVELFEHGKSQCLWNNPRVGAIGRGMGLSIATDHLPAGQYDVAVKLLAGGRVQHTVTHSFNVLPTY
jgi:hypothetical protein